MTKPASIDHALTRMLSVPCELRPQNTQDWLRLVTVRLAMMSRGEIVRASIVTPVEVVQ